MLLLGRREPDWQKGGSTSGSHPLTAWRRCSSRSPNRPKLRGQFRDFFDLQTLPSALVHPPLPHPNLLPVYALAHHNYDLPCCLFCMFSEHNLCCLLRNNLGSTDKPLPGLTPPQCSQHRLVTSLPTVATQTSFCRCLYLVLACYFIVCSVCLSTYPPQRSIIEMLLS